MSWLDQDTLTAEQNCSYCLLGADQVQLNSPFGYDEEFASQFQSKTSSCGATGYPLTSPSPYAISLSNSTPTMVSPSCTNEYTVQTGDSCYSIAVSMNVSTYSITGPNSLNQDCSNLIAGSSICLADPCDLYVVQPDDTCASVLDHVGGGVTGTQLLAWNPNVNALCGSLFDLRGTYICVG